MSGFIRPGRDGPVRLDKEIWQGDNSPPLEWGFGPEDAPEIPQGADFRLEIGWFGTDGVEMIEAASPASGLAIDYDKGVVAWSYTTAQSAALPRGAVAGYHLRILYEGQTEIWARGRLVGMSEMPLVGAFG